MAVLSGVFPVVYALLVAAILSHKSAVHRSVRDAVVLAGVAFAGWAAAGAELLSIPRALTFWPVVAWWTVPAVVLAWVAVRRRASLRAAIGDVPRPGARVLLIIGAGILPLLAVTAVVAALTPPTTWDCMSYHMPRQVYWMLNGGVQHFGTNDARQLEMPPLAEYIGVQWMILAGGDGPSNMVQWSALALCAVAVSGVAKDLGGGAPVQALAGLLAVALPAATTQAVNPKNDVVCAFFALVLLGTGARIWVDRQCGWDRALFIGLTLGLLLLTKGTGVTVAVPVCLLIGIGVLRARGPRGLAPGVGMVTIALAINAPHWARNIETFKTPIGHTAAQTRFPQRNLIHTPAAVASNLVRNIAMELATPWPNVNERMRREVERVHRVLGLSTNDPRTTLMVKDPFKVPENWREDGDNPSHVHLLLGALMLGAIAARPRAWLQAPAWPFYLVAPATFVLFSALLTWQPWQNRLLIPVLMMGIPFGAVLLNLGWAVYPRTIAAVLAPALAWPCLLYNESKPLVGPQAVWGRPREEVLFEVQPAAREPIEKAVEYVRSRSPRSVGLWLGWTNSYYLLRPLVWPREGAPRLVMVNVNFGPKPAATELPELMVRWPSESAAVGQKYASRMYVGAAEFGPVLVLVPERPGPRR